MINLVEGLSKPTDYCTIYLNRENPNFDFEKSASPKYLDEYIRSELKKNNKQFGVGGYLEERAIYSASDAFSNRNIHLAVDVWTAANTPICSPLDALVHSFQYNAAPYDYGTTIILEHNYNGLKFYTLYGHLKLDSLNALFEGKKIKAGEIFTHIGEEHENGGWCPHLHFQLIVDIQNYKGDYVGVCSKEDLDYYKKNCPDPSHLLRIEGIVNYDDLMAV